VATPSDEALALLILENSWDKWNQEAALAVGQTIQNNEKERTKWTSNAMSLGKFEGWGTEGVPRYNSLYMVVKMNHQNNIEFDKEYQQLQREKITTKAVTSNKKPNHRIQVPCYNDMDDLNIEFIGV
jgi:hypothetical protein